MPNHVNSTLRVTGPAEDIARFKEAAKYGDAVLSFQSLYPMPEDLRETSNPSKIVSQDEYNAYQERKAAGALTDMEKMCGACITDEIQWELFRKYGVDNWYDWACKNYGTKWGVYNTSLLERFSDDTKLLYAFDTAWSPASDGWKKISAEWPTLRFETFVCDEGNSFEGRLDYENGELVYELVESNTLREATIEAVKEIAAMEPEEAIRRYSEFESEFEYDDCVMNALKSRMAGEVVLPLVDVLKDERFKELNDAA